MAKQAATVAASERELSHSYPFTSQRASDQHASMEEMEALEAGECEMEGISQNREIQIS